MGLPTLYSDLNQHRVILELEPRYTSDPGVLDLVQVIASDGRRVPLTAFTTRTQGLADDWIPTATSLLYAASPSRRQRGLHGRKPLPPLTAPRLR